MSRTSRKNIASQFIHLITQGIDREYIFQNDIYKREYLKFLNDNIREFKTVKVLAYCIMDNHAHFLMFAPNIKDVSSIMRKVNTAFGIYYNKNNDRVGYVFRNRYNTQPILDQKHLFNTLVYIHKNPVKANIVKEEKDYKYSSYNYYAQNKVDKEKVRLIFGTDNYIEQFQYIHNNFKEDNILEVKDDQESVEEILKITIKNFCDMHNCTIDYIRKDNYLLKALIIEIKNKCNTTNKVIAQYIGIGKNRINNINKKKN